jgi:Fanconi-associated nuclease 1
LTVASDGTRVIVTAGDRIYALVGGKVQGHVTRKDKTLSTVILNATGTVWAVSVDEKVIVLQNRRQLGRFGAPRSPSLAFDADSNRILAWSGKRLIVATLTGKVVADIEFAKAISHVHGVDRGRIVAGAGYFIVLDVASPSKAMTDTSMQVKNEPATPATSSVRPTEESGIPIRWIDGEKLGTEGGKARYVGGNGQGITIEQLTLEHYAQLGYQGTWSENEYWWALMGLLFWDVIFAPLPGVYTPEFGGFPSRLQDMPSDFFTDDFYPRRERLIEKRIADLTQSKLFGLRKPNIEAELRNAFRRHNGQPCRPIDWNRIHSVNELLVAPRVLTDQQLIRIMQRLLVNFAHNRSGLPDLFLYRKHQPLFCEVKSEEERVASHQIDWLHYLRDEVGVPVEICRVVQQDG